MSTTPPDSSTYPHDHSFGQGIPQAGEKRTHVVIVLTAAMMVGEILAGLAYGSMALLADGLHMASHAAALGIAAFAYAFTRRHAGNPAYSFGVGKANALGGFSGAVLLAGFALLMGGESLHRLVQPTTIAFDQAILVAVLGLLVNGICVFLLANPAGGKSAAEEHAHAHAHAHDLDHDHAHGHHHDHNLRSAYLHVLADALTSLLAIFALLVGKLWHWNWMDPIMGLVGAVLVARWSLSLLRVTSGVLLDRQAKSTEIEQVRQRLEQEADARVLEIHLWEIAPGRRCLIVALEASMPQSPAAYKALLPPGLGIVHASVEVHQADKLQG